MILRNDGSLTRRMLETTSAQTGHAHKDALTDCVQPAIRP